MTKRRDLELSKHSIVAIFLQLVAILLYFVAFYSNEWFIVEPSHYGIWSVTFCDILTCQSIPTIFNDQPGWYFFVQVFNVIALVLAIASFIILCTTVCIKKLSHFHAAISTSFQIGVCSMMAGMIVFYVSLIQENQMSRPSISWSASLASISGVLQISALFFLVN